MEQPISENLWWVIPGKLAGVRKPTLDEISELKTVGVQALVSVLDDPSNLDLYEQAGLPYRWLPIKGGTAPNLEQIQTLKEFVEQQNSLGCAVAVHCTNGKRRTGTLLAAYLISTGWSYDSTLEKIQTVNPGLDLREGQIQFLQALASSLADDHD